MVSETYLSIDFAVIINFLRWFDLLRWLRKQMDTSSTYPEFLCLAHYANIHIFTITYLSDIIIIYLDCLDQIISLSTNTKLIFSFTPPLKCNWYYIAIATVFVIVIANESNLRFNYQNKFSIWKRSKPATYHLLN